MPTNYQVNGSNFENLFLRRDLFSQGGLWLAGHNTYGELGNNLNTHASSPIQTVAGGTNWKDIAAGFNSFAAIKTDGTLWCWGKNNLGTVGNNSTTDVSSPVQTISGGTNWKSVVSFGATVAALKTDGSLWMWGNNSAGQLGNNSAGGAYSSPIQTISATKDWKFVAVGYDSTAAIKTDNSIWLWGNNEYGKLGTSVGGGYSSPTQTVGTATNWKNVACGWRHMAAVKTDGTLWAWGYNNSGQVGDGTSTTRYSPVQIAGNNWKQTAGTWYSTIAIKTDGTMWGWGQGTATSTQTNSSSPIQNSGAGTNWKLVSGGYYMGCATKTDGTFWLWGDNTYGQLGTNNTTNSTSPKQYVMGGTNWKKGGVGQFISGGITDIF